MRVQSTLVRVNTDLALIMILFEINHSKRQMFKLFALNLYLLF